MNGEAKKTVHIVDKAKAAKVNKKVNKVFNKRNQDEWDFIPKFYIDGAKLVGSIFFIPIVLVVAILEGVKAGFVAGMQKALAMYR